MALLSGSPRTATARSASDVELLEIDRQDFERLIAGDHVLARAVERVSHDRTQQFERRHTRRGKPAAAAGNGLIGGSFPLLTVFSEAVAGAAALALVTHAMIPEAIEEAGSLIVLPTTAGFRCPIPGAHGIFRLTHARRDTQGSRSHRTRFLARHFP